MRTRWQTKLNEVKAELQQRMHEPIPELGKWFQAVVRGHTRYYGVSHWFLEASLPHHAQRASSSAARG